MTLFENPTRVLFFTGKGGVGKTSLACAAAVALADRGRRVLLVSTDPASNLDEVLGVPLGRCPTAIPAVPNLFALNLDPAAAAAEYRERMVGPYRKLLPPAAVTSMEEQFSGSCTVEIAAFEEFARLLGDPAATADFEHVVFDTAPTGHTLRLLTLPSAWSGFLDSNTTGTSCLGPLAGLQARREIYGETVRALGDPALTTIHLVARPETAPLREAARTSEELAALGVTNRHLIVNGLFAAGRRDDPVAVSLERQGAAALAAMPAEIASLPRTVVPLSAGGMLGIPALRALAAGTPAPTETVETDSDDALPPGLVDVLDDLETAGHGVILTMGKGGVGKTTVAAAVAIGLARRGHAVRLSTTDPAAHLAGSLGGDVLPNLTVGRIDPRAEIERYSAEVMATAGAGLDDAGKALLAEDLRSPCTEEIAVFRAFALAVAAGREGFVVLDTAPTGHTVLLLDSALAYHREAARQAGGVAPEVEALLPRLRDPSFTRVLIVTLPEATPVHEAAQLQQDLRRAGIEPYAWVINRSLLPLSLVDPILAGRRSLERPFVREVRAEHAARVVLVPLQAEPPIGVAALAKLTAPDPLPAGVRTFVRRPKCNAQ